MAVIMDPVPVPKIKLRLIMPPIQIKRTIKLTTQQSVIEGRKPVAEGFPMRKWSISVHLLNDKGEEVPATIFDKVTYKLHPTFANPNRAIKKPPFTITEEGWGEFDMEVVLHTMEKGGDHSIKHDLHFQEAKYESTSTITFSNPKPGLMKVLAQSGPVPGLEAFAEQDGGSRKAQKAAPEEKPAKKSSRSMKNKFLVQIDMEKLAEGLQKLHEDDLLKVVQMVHEHKTPDTWIKNDVERRFLFLRQFLNPPTLNIHQIANDVFPTSRSKEGEFHIDLYTLPDHLVKSLWQFTTSKVDV
ncbi:hypothetical protein H072_1461 [Dactylellina haptotyla CBS 200.50]|uniref:YEATS domain-containing protein n=1 Tax=Dactylellina haptotyla (strain CBS 200.50) TaxID=1284197 RepID=S8BYI7_DACHA|nr:hypothetical protein H072_1461 [Dactylellina haptotyla CBS 200.50]